MRRNDASIDPTLSEFVSRSPTLVHLVTPMFFSVLSDNSENKVHLVVRRPKQGILQEHVVPNFNVQGLPSQPPAGSRGFP